MSSSRRYSERSNCHLLGRKCGLRSCLALLLIGVTPAFAQQRESSQPVIQNGSDLQRRVEQLEQEVAELRRLIQERNSLPPLAETIPVGHIPVNSNAPAVSPSSTEGKSQEPATAHGAPLTAEDRKTLDFLRDTTVNLGLDGYYAYNFNHPVGRVNLLRAYDVLSNNISLKSGEHYIRARSRFVVGTSIRRPLGPAVRPSHRYAARKSRKRAAASDLPEYFPGVRHVHRASREGLDRGFWKMGQFDWNRGQLH